MASDLSQKALRRHRILRYTPGSGQARMAKRRGGRMRITRQGAYRRAASSLVLVVLTAAVASAQAQAPEAAPAPASTSPTSNGAPGFFGGFGQWMAQGVDAVGAGFGSVTGIIGGHASEAARSVSDGASNLAKGAADAARDTAAAVTRLPVTSIVSGREACLPAPNGAPDCRAAAEMLCRTSGYNGGNSVDFETAEKCPPRPRTAARNASPAEPAACTLEHFVTRALCR
jgi:hypothetical protein